LLGVLAKKKANVKKKKKKKKKKSLTRRTTPADDLQHLLLLVENGVEVNHVKRGAICEIWGAVHLAAFLNLHLLEERTGIFQERPEF